jgi:hypothetical protein
MLIYILKIGERGNVVGWGTTLQAEQSQVRVPW